MARRVFLALGLIVLLVAGGLWFLYSGPQPPLARKDIAPAPQVVLAPTAGAAAPAPAAALAPAPALVLTRDCTDDPAYAAAARANAESLTTRVAAPMGREETGWEIYAPLVAQEAGVACAPDSTAFAAALARWQTAHRLPATGTLEPATLEAMRLIWHGRRPFVAANKGGACPAAPDEATLADTREGEGYSGKPIKLRSAALEAWRRMTAAARAEEPQIAADPRLLTIFSGFRGPVEETARCTGGDCSTPAKASCSAHRTGLAVDLYLGEASGFRPESSADPNRLHLSRTAAYRWLVQNAARFGFVPYAFEPWHWEWTGEAP
jgi:LAS superfamily LD-carboxypeptidase LdcB